MKNRISLLRRSLGHNIHCNYSIKRRPQLSAALVYTKSK